MTKGGADLDTPCPVKDTQAYFRRGTDGTGVGIVLNPPPAESLVYQKTTPSGAKHGPRGRFCFSTRKTKGGGGGARQATAQGGQAQDHQTPLPGQITETGGPALSGVCQSEAVDEERVQVN